MLEPSSNNDTKTIWERVGTACIGSELRSAIKKVSSEINCEYRDKLNEVRLALLLSSFSQQRTLLKNDSLCNRINV
jgi:ABC-type molybdenum transport system ATPase subunit/photorepair protein PhrA